MQVILTMMTNDNDSVVHDYGYDGNDAHHAPHVLAAPRPGGQGAAVGSQKRLGNKRRRWFIMMMIIMMMARIMMMEDNCLNTHNLNNNIY